ncbi:PA2169 family four-helix-bundle protein [Luteimonas yindakuii]|uniref:PA2169 family four-helix-bundle protein n=1 Tax=Luteimonas yindakuii TaxID=2565782 RepID=A0A4Z1R2L8_9GAMM|nr:PA2169 family four-helix-bundle protein [Luteimonas yindakuii]QCU72509.1 PA2169 family four-helix-bundle protein [Luteimonas yindakuii]TKS53750.1 PA2169 family four-helix-bundle protein [Luteimonas yindakuii]
MNQQSRTTGTLNDLIAIARDGQEFYQDASTRIDDVELKSLFTRIAGTKATIIAELGAAVQAVGGDPEDSGTLRGSMQEMYARVRAALGDKEYSYVAELEESEDRLLHAFEDAVKDDSTPAAARSVVTRLMPEVRACHDLMRARKHAMKGAS